MFDFVRRWRSLPLSYKVLGVVCGFVCGTYTWLPFFEEIKRVADIERQKQLEELQTKEK